MILGSVIDDSKKSLSPVINKSIPESIAARRIGLSLGSLIEYSADSFSSGVSTTLMNFKALNKNASYLVTFVGNFS